MKAITSGTVSLHAAARTRNTAARTQRSSSMYRNAQSSSGVARATGWNSLRTRKPSAGYSRYAPARKAPAVGSRVTRVPSLKAGHAPVAAIAACPTSSITGLGQTSQGSANSARMGSTCEPSRDICRGSGSPVVISRKWPCAVLYTACTMLPRS